MAHQRHDPGPPRVIQGSFQGRVPAFAAQVSANPFAVRDGKAEPAVSPRRTGNAFEVPPTVNLAHRKPGQPLLPVVQQKMASFFQADFSDVRIHVGPQASSIGAQAFTMGSDIFFAPGQYQPHSALGQQLLGHELAHVVQQRAGRARNPFGSGVAVVQQPHLELEADRMGRQAARHPVSIQASQETWDLEFSGQTLQMTRSKARVSRGSNTMVIKAAKRFSSRWVTNPPHYLLRDCLNLHFWAARVISSRLPSRFLGP